ncbi:galactose mutarotase [Pontibacter qinzhouensis]|uniref:Aldose 1-epimerase n=1 Tax=Pontibacter qinzhouensis TaxID=2603253 RepID=A0A5C8K5F0_9BACT|nr:aldose epimerase family protein [Pontibacter qinzhouensis]TXK44313.1 galactose mutarotase [Pontibacter qinzhouensis]
MLGIFVIFLFMIFASASTTHHEPPLSISKKLWGNIQDEEVWLYKLTNSNGMTVEITNYGAIVVSISTPNCDGEFENVVLGFDNLTQYKTQNSYFMGATIGRFANRIAGAEFVLDNTSYKLAANDNTNHSHGGRKGFDKVVWNASEVTGADSVGVVLQYVSKHMEEGYPGNLNVQVTYVLNDRNELKIYYEATTDKPTIVNLTHHSYFNLTAGKSTILDHELTIFADSITPTDQAWIPTGELASVAGTDFDFTKPYSVGERITNLPYGYNMNFVLRKKFGHELSKAAEVFDAKSGRRLEVYTTEPGLQLYTADYMDGSLKGSDNISLEKNMGLCLEAQHFPDSPNKVDFPSTVLRPGQTYSQLTIYRFSRH